VAKGATTFHRTSVQGNIEARSDVPKDGFGEAAGG